MLLPCYITYNRRQRSIYAIDIGYVEKWQLKKYIIITKITIHKTVINIICPKIGNGKTLKEISIQSTHKVHDFYMLYALCIFYTF